jgi:hypothetical protein
VTRTARNIVIAALVWLVAAALAAPAGAARGDLRAGRSHAGRRAAGGGGGGLSFTKPVALESFAPARTATSTVYSARNGESPSDHEWSGEPVIQVDDKGIIYIAGTCCVVASSPVWRSTDDGKKFTEMESPGHVREWGIGAEGDLAVDHKGNVFFVDTYIPGLLMSAWSDHGKSWEYTIPANGVVPGFDDRPWLAYSNKALYLYVNHVSHTAVYSSADGGQTWSTEGPLSWDGSPLGQPYFPGHIAAHEKTGALWVSGVVTHNDESVLGSAVSKDGGKTFTEAVITKPQREGGFSPIFTGTTAVDSAGNGYTTWSTYDKKGCDVYYAASTNGGKSWHDPVKVNTGPGCATFPWVTAGGNGKIALAWYETPATKRADPGELALRTLTGQTIYNGLELPLAAFQDEVSDDAPWHLHVAAIRDAGAARPRIAEARVPTKTPVLLGPMDRELWDFLQLDIGPDGRVHVTYSDKYKDSAPQTWYVGTKGGPSLR